MKSDSWLGEEGCIASDYCATELTIPMIINAMVTQSGEWDWQALNIVLPYYVLQHIGLGNDLPAWRWETDIHFFTKSAYWSLVNVEELIGRWFGN
ncbi:hypothetical protein V6N13_074543 [Hibiscus sabdariffa]